MVLTILGVRNSGYCPEKYARNYSCLSYFKKVLRIILYFLIPTCVAVGFKLIPLTEE